jgi:hypothetical protein
MEGQCGEYWTGSQEIWNSEKLSRDETKTRKWRCGSFPGLVVWLEVHWLVFDISRSSGLHLLHPLPLESQLSIELESLLSRDSLGLFTFLSGFPEQQSY